ncbi:hypothetical protein RRG08_049510 [Elysia crispata]|uniref:Uncharacterized protein n=1 Tax=Elysia crispata TaxID=231223 RepID=A0AAE1DEP7_9GAST|nr:hypothetical protein RRG08_049510 [Elysia crispata]
MIILAKPVVRDKIIILAEPVIRDKTIILAKPVVSREKIIVLAKPVVRDKTAAIAELIGRDKMIIIAEPVRSFYDYDYKRFDSERLRGSVVTLADLDPHAVKFSMFKILTRRLILKKPSDQL